ncbi:MAG: hypothetical protein P4L22_02785 [Candidatus Babeliales bacterium]|nr:hypothetical protein [Candidatus Babeliales bacterium]
MNKIKFLIFMSMAIINQAYAMEILFGDISDLQQQDLNSSDVVQKEDESFSLFETPENQKKETPEVNNLINISAMLRKLTYLYESQAQELLQKISQPNQEVTRVQELAYHLAFIKEILGYTNAIIDSIKIEQV